MVQSNDKFLNFKQSIDRKIQKKKKNMTPPFPTAIILNLNDSLANTKFGTASF